MVHFIIGIVRPLPNFATEFETMSPGSVPIKFVSTAETEYKLEQGNPEASLTFPKHTVAVCGLSKIFDLERTREDGWMS